MGNNPSGAALIGHISRAGPWSRHGPPPFRGRRERLQNQPDRIILLMQVKIAYGNFDQCDEKEEVYAVV
jgi:hypothetical protein